MIRRSALVFGLATVLAGLSGCVNAYRVKESATLTESLRAPAPSGRLVVRNQVGRIVIESDAAATGVSAEVVKIGKGATPAEADAAAAEIRVGLLVGRDNTLEARAEHPNSGSRREYEVQWRIKAPPRLAIDVANNVGDVTIEGFERGAQVRLNVGDVSARRIRGGLSARTDVGALDVTASGRIDALTDVGDARVVVLPGEDEDVRVRSRVGKVRAEFPRSRRGTLVVETDLGSADLQPADAQLVRAVQRGKRTGDGVGTASKPVLTLVSDIGDVTARAYAEAPR